MLYSGGRLVVKFGGTSVKDDFKEAVTFVSRLWDENEVAVVVSAIKGVTDALLEFSSTRKGFEWIERVHKDFAKKYGISFEVFIDPLRELKNLSREDFPSFEAYRDHILSYGEWLSGLAFTEALRREGIPVELFKPWEIIETDGNFGNANVDMGKTSRNLKVVGEALESGKVAVVPGFIGSYCGLRTTLGREGSDYTAAVLGEGLKARAVLIMSDVDGIYTADPRRVVSAKLIPFVSYEELYVASKAGMKAIHHGAIDVVRGIPIIFGRTRDWSMGTIAGYESSSLPILVHRINGEKAVITAVGVPEIPGFESENGSERGIPWARIEVPASRLGSTLNRLHLLLVSGRVNLPRTLSIVHEREASANNI
ncbi:Aspartokinase [Thermococcus sp. 2319x1]|uniref:aspartate kinase n=1 Tax=Thermococcus sp. 2319x1 TaxID=1674923 RepID=UPI00073AC436|nr:aspartate kinase [Thermococcus sp. 2319x1]ALV62500.1 Aspartokinase [Thermococcus sp. 2319x1]